MKWLMHEIIQMHFLIQSLMIKTGNQLCNFRDASFLLKTDTCRQAHPHVYTLTQRSIGLVNFVFSSFRIKGDTINSVNSWSQKLRDSKARGDSNREIATIITSLKCCWQLYISDLWSSLALWGLYFLLPKYMNYIFCFVFWTLEACSAFLPFSLTHKKETL